jgi:hypothetical protein
MPRGSKPGERRGGRQPGTPNKKTALVNAAFDAATSSPDLSPLDFLLGVMKDTSVSPDLRIKAAQAAAPYVHSKTGRSQATSTKHIEAVGEFVIEPGVARILRDDMERLSRFDRQLSSAEEREKSELRKRIAETAKGISCPANYGRKEAEKDRERLRLIFCKRRLGASGAAETLNEAEIAKEAQLAARVAAFDAGPVPRAHGRMLELTLRDFSRGLSSAETEELESLRKAYLPDPPAPDALMDALQAWLQRSADAVEKPQRFRAGSKS